MVPPKHLVGQKITFNIVNFTKNFSLYSQGMRVCIRSYGNNAYLDWERGGDDIKYGKSKIIRKSHQDKNKIKYYY